MEWTPDGSNQDIEDRRDESGGGGFGGFGFGHLGIGGILILGLLSLVFHQNFFAVLSGSGAGSQAEVRSTPHPAQDRAEAREASLIKTVFHNIQNSWAVMLPEQAHIPYRHATLVLFRDSTPSGCGLAQDATGPFYCPQDEKVYLDLGFFDELKSRFGGSNADFAQSYVIAHEVGHHVQKLLGTEERVRTLESEQPRRTNALSVDVELQADCYAGVWGNSARDTFKLTREDIQDALSAAAAVGDDHLQRMATGHVSPETFTHGTSAQRDEWFTRGYQSGEIAACNTFRR